MVARASYPISYRFDTPYTADSHPIRSMPKGPAKQGQTNITLELRTDLVEHLDTQARYLGQSRAAYLRGLVIKDMDRQGPGRVATA